MTNQVTPSYFPQTLLAENNAPWLANKKIPLLIFFLTMGMGVLGVIFNKYLIF